MYNREKAKAYAKKWAYGRNPKYYNFDSVGGDCTSFVSQCIYEGIGVMNFNQYGWYYKNGNDKSASWSGVEFLYKFLINNKGVGPKGKIVKREDVQIGDIMQLKFPNQDKFSHTLFIINVLQQDIFVATHTYDAYNRNINSYIYEDIRYIKIL